MFIKYSCSIR